MKKALSFILCMYVIMNSCISQIVPQKFGKGIQLQGIDSTYHLKMNFRLQSLYIGDWNVDDGFSDFNSNFLIRRSRLKFGGWAVSPKLKYKLELSLSNRDVGGGNSAEFGFTSSIVLDAFLEWNFSKNLFIRAGQFKLPGNRERLISSGSLQFVDRSRLNSRFTLDRDVGLQLMHKINLSEQFKLKTIVALTQGEGKNVTIGNLGGYNLTYKIEMYPFGSFQSKGDYVGAAIKRESKPKLALAFGYENNNTAPRERGQKGSFIISEGIYYGKDLNSIFADLMFKYQNWSVMIEYFNKTVDGSPIINDSLDNEIGTYYVGTAYNVQAGYMMDSNWEIALRYTSVNPDVLVDGEEVQYTFGISKYVVGHNLKFQTDFTLRDRALSSNRFLIRSQVEFQF